MRYEVDEILEIFHVTRLVEYNLKQKKIVLLFYFQNGNNTKQEIILAFLLCNIAKRNTKIKLNYYMRNSVYFS